MENLDIKFNELKVNSVLDQLESNGFEGFLVGGCVRDILMSKTPKDYDVATNATPKQIIEIFDNVIPTGIKHGTVTVVLDGEGYEVTTYRTDSMYSDNRHPDRVEFVSTIEEDLSRRDFKMNGMAWNKHRGLVDPWGGVQDILKKEISCIGDTEERFKEDSLRIVRALRFSAQLDFNISKNIRESSSRLSYLIKNISVERIKQEIDKILLSNNPEKIGDSLFLDISKNVLVEVYELSSIYLEDSYFTILDKVGKSLDALEKKDLSKCWATLLCDLKLTHPMDYLIVANDVMERLHFDKKSKNKILNLIKGVHEDVKTTKYSVKKLINKLGSRELFEEVVDIKTAIFTSVIRLSYNTTSKEITNLYIQIVFLSDVGDIIFYEKDPIFITDLSVSGSDILKLGYKGREIGLCLDFLMDIVLKDKEKNNKETLINILEKNRGFLNE